jgi:hypothetical protein
LIYCSKTANITAFLYPVFCPESPLGNLKPQWETDKVKALGGLELLKSKQQFFNTIYSLPTRRRTYLFDNATLRQAAPHQGKDGMASGDRQS